MNEEGKSIKLHPFVLASFATANVHGKKGYKILDDQTPSSFHLIPLIVSHLLERCLNNVNAANLTQHNGWRFC